MKTVLITAGTRPVPGGLREIIERGSTAVLEHRASELGSDAASGTRLGMDADRIVFWSASDDAGLRQVVERLAAAEAAERREIVVFVTVEQGGPQPSSRLGPNEVFVWPRDEDRLKMAFLTGA